MCQATAEAAARMRVGDPAQRYVSLDAIEAELGLEETVAARALVYAVEQGWLIVKGRPLHSVSLAEAARQMLQRQRRQRR